MTNADIQNVNNVSSSNTLTLGSNNGGDVLINSTNATTLTSSAYTNINAYSCSITTNDSINLNAANVLGINATQQIALTSAASFIQFNSGTGIYTFNNIPTSDPMISGAIWSAGGVLRISP
jgi:hypothetical protein